MASFKQDRFRYCASAAQIWFQTSIVHLAAIEKKKKKLNETNEGHKVLLPMKGTMEMNQALIEQGNLFACNWRSTVTDGRCKYHTSNAVGIRCRTCEKMATSTSWMNHYSMTILRIGCEINARKVELCTIGQHNTIRTSMTTCTQARDIALHRRQWRDCATPHDAHSTEHSHWAPCTVSHSHLDLIHTFGSSLSLAFSHSSA